MTISEVAQSPNPGAQIALFRLDATSVGGGMIYFTQNASGGQPISYGGLEYQPYDVEFTDMEINAGGVLPQPKMRLANSDPTGFIQTLINAFGDLVGCEIRRVRTFERYLDGQPEEDPTAYIGPDVFRIERKAVEGDDFVEYELSASFDQEGTMLPREQVIRDICPKRYRRFDPDNPDAAGDGYVYATINPCPYTATAAYTAENQPTTAAFDVCGLHLSSCKLRFGEDQPLPYGGFPGAARVRV